MTFDPPPIFATAKTAVASNAPELKRCDASFDGITRRTSLLGIIIFSAAVAAIGTAYGYHEYRKRIVGRCQHRTYESLMNEFLELATIWKERIACLDEREAVEKIEAERVELAVKQGSLTESDAFDIEMRLFEETMAGEKRYSERFQVRCRTATGT